MRRRILWAMVAVTALAVITFALPLGVTTISLSRSQEVNRLEQMATILSRSLPDTGLDGGTVITLDEPVAPATGAVYDPAGNRMTGQGPQSADSAVIAALGGKANDRHQGGDLIVAVPVLDEGSVVGAIRVAEPWAMVAQASQRRWTLMAAAGIAAIAVAAALAAALARRLVAPIDDVVATAVHLGEGDFGSRVEPSGIPELDRAGDALNRTAERLASLVGRERAFAADVSHQLSTPLTSLRLTLESALLGGETDHRPAVEAAIRETDRMQATIETFLAVARDHPGAEERADLAAICRSIAAIAAETIRGSDRRIDLVGDPVGEVACPPLVLTEIVRVLVENACRHGYGTITMTLRQRGSGVALTVSDEGSSLTPDRAARLFSRRDAGAAGHGIGLSLGRSLAQAHDLRLELTQVEPHTVFTLACPGAPPRR